MIKLRQLLWVSLAVLITGCGSDSDDDGAIKTIELGPFKKECTYFVTFLCTTRPSADESEWVSFFPGVGGLAYEWGYEYTVLYRDTPVEPLPDGLGFRRDLVEVTRKEPVPANTEFTLALRASREFSRPVDFYLTKLEAGLYQLFSSTEIECLTTEVCDELDTVIEEDLKFLATFTFRPELGLPIILKEIICTEPNRYQQVFCGDTIGLVTTLRLIDTLGQDETQFGLGETIEIEMTLTNTGSEPIILVDPCYYFDIRVTAPQFVGTDRFEWVKRAGSNDCQENGLTDDALAVGTSATLSYLWGQTDPLTIAGPFVLTSWFLNQPEHQLAITIL